MACPWSCRQPCEGLCEGRGAWRLWAAGLAALAGGWLSPELKLEAAHIYAVEARDMGPKPVLAGGRGRDFLPERSLVLR